jgi:hypothetical protein
MGRISQHLKVVRGWGLLALLLLAVAPAGALAKPKPPVLPPTAHPYGQSYSEWAADWWQWALEQPADTNPLLDETGAQCANEQQGKVWFLAGTLASDPVTRSCTVPTGTALLFPVVNAFSCVDTGDPVPPDAVLREQVAYVRSATGLTATIDGAAVPNVPAYFEESAVFSITLPGPLPDDNVLGAPPGVYEPCVDAGYYIVVRPLPPGEHTIHFTGTVVVPGPEPSEFNVDVTYNITTVAGR